MTDVVISAANLLKEELKPETAVCIPFPTNSLRWFLLTTTICLSPGMHPFDLFSPETDSSARVFSKM